MGDVSDAPRRDQWWWTAEQLRAAGWEMRGLFLDGFDYQRRWVSSRGVIAEPDDDGAWLPEPPPRKRPLHLLAEPPVLGTLADAWCQKHDESAPSRRCRDDDPRGWCAPCVAKEALFGPEGMRREGSEAYRALRTDADAAHAATDKARGGMSDAEIRNETHFLRTHAAAMWRENHGPKATKLARWWAEIIDAAMEWDGLYHPEPVPGVSDAANKLHRIVRRGPK